MTHTFKILILAVCCIVISMVPATADELSNYFNAPSSSGTFGQSLTYTGNGQTFTDGNLQFQFTGLTIIPTCWEGSVQVQCQTGSYNPVSAATLNVAATSTLNGYNGFDLQGQVDTVSYCVGEACGDGGGVQVNVEEDINLNYTVSTTGGAASITDAHLDVGACASESGGSMTPGGTNCLSQGSLPPNLSVLENFAGTNQTISASAPPNILNAMADFSSPYSSLLVSKDIALESGACAGCEVGFSDLKQYYSQVPEPRTYAWILGLGLFGLVQFRRRFATNQ